jgi:hydrogenase nickel incorporation protein HypA/HybF
MHELGVIKSILRICTERMEAAGKTKIKTISLQVGELRNIEEEWMQKYFEYFSPGTPAEGAKISIRKIPLTFHCEECNYSYHPNPRDRSSFHCPKCNGDNYDMISGRELLIESIEAE